MAALEGLDTGARRVLQAEELCKMTTNAAHNPSAEDSRRKHATSPGPGGQYCHPRLDANALVILERSTWIMNHEPIASDLGL